MALKRFISSSMSVDEKLAAIGAKNFKHALMWPWILTQFDDWGRARFSPVAMKLSLFPAFPEISALDIEEAVFAYAEEGLVHSYEVEGKRYLAVRPSSWIKYQTYLIGTKRAGNDSSSPCPVDAPWSLEEEIELRLVMTKGPEKNKAESFFREKIQLSADNQECPQTISNVRRQKEMSADISGVPALAVPSPSPSLKSKTSNRAGGYVDNPKPENPESQSLQDKTTHKPDVDNMPTYPQGKKRVKPDREILVEVQKTLVSRNQLSEPNQEACLSIVDLWGKDEGLKRIRGLLDDFEHPENEIPFTALLESTVDWGRRIERERTLGAKQRAPT